ncbi:MAG: hypothetical protein IAE80_12220 [Anaerolinea sp.]|nr:hypothetical protein [Anaerolinea sp.]
MRRFTLALAVALLLLSAAFVSPQAAAAQTIPACDPNAPVQVVSIGVDGQPIAYNYYGGTISGNNRYIAFAGFIPETGVYRSFVRDRLTCQTEIVSVDSDEIPIESTMSPPLISHDGRYVVFEVWIDSENRRALYQRDRQAGVTTLVSIMPSGANVRCEVGALDMSADGRYLLFFGVDADACFPLLNQYHQIYVRDTLLNTTELITVALNGQPSQLPPGVSPFGGGAISNDGRFAYFFSSAADLVAGDTNGFSDIFMRDRLLQQTTRLTHAYDGGQTNEGSQLGNTVTSDNRYVAFSSYASNLVPNDNNGVEDSFVLDRQTGTLERLPPVSVNGVESNSRLDSISADGRYVVQYGASTYIRDQKTGVAFNLWANPQANPINSTSFGPVLLSEDGRYVVYVLFPPDPTGESEIEVYVAEWQRLLPPAAPTPVAPASAIPVTQPTFTWNTVTDGAWYYLWVTGADGHVMDQWYDAWNICTGDTCSVTPLDLPTGQYQWWVQAWSPYGGYGAWNSGAAFTVTVPPAAPTISAPSGVIAGNQPTYRWNSVPGASWYDLWVSDESGFVLDQWYDGSTICAAGECAVTPPVPLDGGLQRVWVQAWSPYGGYSAWSAEAQFAVAPSAPTPFAPVGTVAPEVAFQWTPVQGGAWYYVWLSNDAGKVFDTWFSAADHCGGAVCATQLMPLPAGNYRWWVQAWSPYGGYGAWSGQADFSIAAPMPEEVTPPEVAPPEVQVGGL